MRPTSLGFLKFFNFVAHRPLVRRHCLSHFSSGWPAPPRPCRRQTCPPPDATSRTCADREASRKTHIVLLFIDYLRRSRFVACNSRAFRSTAKTEYCRAEACLEEYLQTRLRRPGAAMSSAMIQAFLSVTYSLARSAPEWRRPDRSFSVRGAL